MKCSSKAKFYHSIDIKRGIPGSTLRVFEKQGHKLIKLPLDIKYFESYLDLNLRPEFLKFKPTNLSVYKDAQYLYQTVLRKKLKKVIRSKKQVRIQYFQNLLSLKNLA